MSMDFRNKSGATFHTTALHWAVFLTLAQTFRWKPSGTLRPPGLASAEKWNGRYDTNDGQIVSDDDAKRLAQALHAAAVYEKLDVALTDVIRHVEGQIEAAGTKFPDFMRMEPEHFREEFSPLLMFLYQGEFIID